MLERCESCKGKKKMLGLGNIVVDCVLCMGVGYISKPDVVKKQDEKNNLSRLTEALTETNEIDIDQAVSALEPRFIDCKQEAFDESSDKLKRVVRTRKPRAK